MWCFIIVSAVVVGGLVTELIKNVDFLWWLSYSKSIGIPLDKPFVLDLSVLKFSISFEVGVSVCQIIFLVISIFVYRKIR